MSGTGFWVAITRLSSHFFQFGRPLSTASCQRRSIPPLPKTGSKHKKYHYVYSPVDMGSAAPSETISTRCLQPASGTAPRPTERLQKSSGSEPCSRTALTVPHRFQIPSDHFPWIRTSGTLEPLDSACQDSHGTQEKKSGGGALNVPSL